VDGPDRFSAGLERWRAKAQHLPPEVLWDLFGTTHWPGEVTDHGAFLQRAALSDLLRDAGARYRAAELGNFVATDPTQEEAIALVQKYLDRIDDHVSAGNSLILYGPCGTGKDHLAVGAGRTAIRLGYTVRWQSAQTIFSDFRDSFSEESSKTEADLMRDLLQPDILIVSDPVPSRGELSDFQGNLLYRLVDARYVEQKPTWTTLNVANVNEARLRVGPATIDRLTHGAVAVFCNWPSYRKPGQP
jgi:DNA replication protein DnaC